MDIIGIVAKVVIPPHINVAIKLYGINALIILAIIPIRSVILVVDANQNLFTIGPIIANPIITGINPIAPIIPTKFSFPKTYFA